MNIYKSPLLFRHCYFFLSAARGASLQHPGGEAAAAMAHPTQLVAQVRRPIAADRLAQVRKLLQATGDLTQDRDDASNAKTHGHQDPVGECSGGERHSPAKLGVQTGHDVVGAEHGEDDQSEKDAHLKHSFYSLGENFAQKFEFLDVRSRIFEHKVTWNRTGFVRERKFRDTDLILACTIFELNSIIE